MGQHVKGGDSARQGCGKNLSCLTGTVPVLLAEDMDDAVAQGAEMAQSGDVVLLSPACASFDMY